MMIKIPPKSYRPGEVIFHEGQPADGLYIVRKGKVRISKGDTKLDELDKNAFFGEMALVDNKPRSATATAVGEVECLRVSTLDFQALVRKLDPLMQGVFRVMIERLRQMSNAQSTPEKNDNPKIDNPD